MMVRHIPSKKLTDQWENALAKENFCKFLLVESSVCVYRVGASRHGDIILEYIAISNKVSLLCACNVI